MKSSYIIILQTGQKEKTVLFPSNWMRLLGFVGYIYICFWPVIEVKIKVNVLQISTAYISEMMTGSENITTAIK